MRLIYHHNLSMNILTDTMKKIFHHNDDVILVLSGWWARGFYTIGVLKYLEEIWMDKKIKTIFGISVWAMIWTFWSAGYSAQKLFDIFMKTPFVSFKNFNILPKKSLLSSNFLKKCFQDNIPDSFGRLTRKLYIWATDIATGELAIFQKWSLHTALLASGAIPGIFPPVKVGKDLFIDGGMVNNLPVDIAKDMYPQSKIIAIALNKFQWQRKVDSILDLVNVSFEIFLRNSIVKNIKKADYQLYPDLSIKVMDTRKSKMKEAYLQWYKDAKKMF